MPIVYFVGGEQDEQATGALLDSGTMKMYAARRDNPVDLIFLGGHRVDEAFSYNLTERKILPEYRHLNGRNVLVERTLTGDKVKSLSVNMMLPNKMVSVTDRIYQAQYAGARYDIVFVPSSCDDGCDSYFWLGEDFNMGVRQYNSAIVGYDDNENPITSMRTLAIVGNLKHYYGLENKLLFDHDAALNTVVLAGERCESTDCAYQTIFIAGADADALLSTNGGASFSTVTTTAITTDTPTADISSAVYVNGNYIVGYTDVVGGTGTDGGVAYSVGGAAFALSTMSAASTGVNKVIEAFGKVYAFGTAGEAYYSCDNGVSFTALTDIDTEDILDAAYDSRTGLMYLALSSATAFAYDGVTFTDISTQVGGTAATDLTSVTILGEGHVVFGGADGHIYENYTADNLSSSYTKIAIAASNVVIGALAGDQYGYRVLAGAGAALRKREALTNQNWQTVSPFAGTGVINQIIAGSPLLDEGVNYFLAVTADGNLVQIATCNLCIGGGC